MIPTVDAVVAVVVVEAFRNGTLIRARAREKAGSYLFYLFTKRFFVRSIASDLTKDLVLSKEP